MIGMRSDQTSPVVKAASRLMALLKVENEQLRQGKPEQIEILLADKTKLLSKMEQALTQFEEQGGDKTALMPTMGDLIALVAENQALLEHMSVVQTEFLKLICAAPVEEITQAYSPSGHYVTPTTESAALTLHSEI